MNSLSSGTEDITADTGQTFGTSISLAVGVPSPLYTNQTVTYVSGASYTSDVSYQTSSQTYTFSKNGNIQITPDISCSFSGSTSITYNLASYSGNAIPSWVTISSSTGQLTITTPNPAVNTDYPFYISSTISGVTGAVNKLITITISSWIVSNWQVCQATDVAIWTACTSGYTLSSNSWSLTPTSTNSPSTTSPTSPANSSTSNNSTSSSINDNFDLKITAQVSKNLIVASFIASSVSLLISNTSMASSISTIWLVINQVQLFFLLFLTRAFIPDQIKEVIIGMDFLLNPFDTIYIFNPQFYGDLLDKLYYEVDNPELKHLKIKSLSTIYNSFSIISGGIFIVILHVIIYFINKWTSNWVNDGRCSKLKLVLKFIMRKAYEIMTFAIYIRFTLELSQFLIVSSISEIWSFDTSGELRVISIAFAIIVLLFYIIVIIMLFLFAISSYREIEGEHNKLSELVSGLKPNRKERFYVAILMARRLIFIIILLVFSFISSKTVIGILVALQVPYIIYLIFIRPFKEMDSTIVELVNEFIFLALLVSLIIFNSESNWTPGLAQVFVQAIWFNSIMSAIITISKSKLMIL